MQYTFDDFRDAFLVILQGLIAKNGIMMADEGHFRVACSNAHGLAVEAAKRLQKERDRASAPALDLTEDGGL